MSRSRTRTLDDSTRATHPGAIPLSDDKLRRMLPELFGIRGLWRRLRTRRGDAFDDYTYIKEQLLYGDSRAAVVVTVDPLLVAAYSTDLDCVAMLRFPQRFVSSHTLHPGSRLLTVNTYGRGRRYQADLIIGEGCSGNWTRFHPLIADFLTDDVAMLALKKEEIPEDEWQLTTTLGEEYLVKRPGVYRDGRPLYALKSALS